ncbi:mitochondrial carrier domain-containing protein [Favolaschia claudopus]|uniref:Mitochondrial carrier domain-containing protein n=1 Tax=Favolaschia claudopus TaxID=2862362 RepID=A0AAW0E308_9AGAR
MSTLRTINELIAGSVGGAAQVLVGQPLDTVKTRAQIAPKGMFKGPMDILMQTIRKEGFFALYKGMASPLLGVAGVNSLLFAAYGASKRIISPFPLSLPEIALAGSMAGAVNAVLASPVEMFKVRMQGQYGAESDKRLRVIAREMWLEWGFRKGVMRGYWVTVAKEIPAYAGFYSAYEFSKRKFAAKYGEQNIPVWALLASGSTGGLAYWLACYPLDVVKSRIQLRETPPTGTPVQYIARELGAVVAEGGLAGLFRGLTPSLLRSIPAAASTFAAYELTREWLVKTTGI